MFKTPDWEDDVPKLHTRFLKKNEKKEKKPPEVKAKVSLKLYKVKEKKPLKAKTKVAPKRNNSFEEKRAVEVKPNFIQNKNVTENKWPPITNGNNKPSRKHKLENKAKNNKKKNPKLTDNSENIPDTQNFDEVLLNAKKKKLNEVIENDDQEDLLFTENEEKKKNIQKKENNVTDASSEPNSSKKNRLKAMLQNQSNRIHIDVGSKSNELGEIMMERPIQSNRRHIDVGSKSNKLRERMKQRLKAAQFRYLNEKLYTSSGAEAQQLFQSDPTAFETYHQGYQLQVKKWPVNPLDVIVKKIMKMPKSHLIADMGCGEAALSKRVPHTVRSFDLVATAPGVEVCDMARTPLLAASVDVAVYCLALMGTDLTRYLVEANRVLKTGGHLLIAEVESRFDNVENFTKEVSRLGFKLKQLDKSNDVFFFMQFTKTGEPPVKKSKLPAITLKPCIYKRR